MCKKYAQESARNESIHKKVRAKMYAQKGKLKNVTSKNYAQKRYVKKICARKCAQ